MHSLGQISNPHLCQTALLNWVYSVPGCDSAFSVLHRLTINVSVVPHSRIPILSLCLFQAPDKAFLYVMSFGMLQLVHHHTSKRSFTVCEKHHVCLTASVKRERIPFSTSNSPEAQRIGIIPNSWLQSQQVSHQPPVNLRQQHVPPLV